jgi:hypothetical protein
MHSALPPFLERIRHHQLFFAGMKLTTKWSAAANGNEFPAAGTTRARCTGTAPGSARLVRSIQGLHPLQPSPARDPGQPVAGARPAGGLSARRSPGWTPKVRRTVDRALVMLLSGYRDGEVICYSAMFPVMREHDLSIERTVEVLGHLGIFRDDATTGTPRPRPGETVRCPVCRRSFVRGTDGGLIAPRRTAQTARHGAEAASARRHKTPPCARGGPSRRD